MTTKEKLVLHGHCVQHKKKLHAQSPLYHEIACHRPIDFRLIGLGYIKFDRLTSRQLYLEQILTASETTFEETGLSLGIIGLRRCRFDTILMEIKGVASTASSSVSARSFSRSSSMRKSTFSTSGHNKLYDDIVLPDKTSEKEWLPEIFPTKSPLPRSCNHTQKYKWLARHAQHMKKRTCSAKKTL
ncbi:unnamed protein product [Diatraea saccharalis]|uniref:Uncharacterized protein n=1 Tax=Diatraea saccharalis TaxID=40085 RepID=A0A9N9R7T1_9NEOP|nr:unnamed protein product [Diatraea saccharalis]